MTTVVHIDGHPANTDDLGSVAFAGYAHFTAMQVRGGRVRGLDVHLERLRSASTTMFGRALPDDEVRAHLRTAITAGAGSVSLLATVFTAAGEFTTGGGQAQLHLLVRTGPAASGPSGPLALEAVPYERPLPTIKHVGEVGKTWYLRQAVAHGFDDAAFLDRQGRFSEATIWNLAFWDGDAVIWPEAEVLLGTTMAILRRRLEERGVPQRTEPVRPTDLPALSGGVVMNSWTPGVAIERIGAQPLPDAPDLLATLHAAFEAEPPVAP